MFNCKAVGKLEKLLKGKGIEQQWLNRFSHCKITLKLLFYRSHKKVFQTQSAQSLWDLNCFYYNDR